MLPTEDEEGYYNFIPHFWDAIKWIYWIIYLVQFLSVIERCCNFAFKYKLVLCVFYRLRARTHTTYSVQKFKFKHVSIACIEKYAWPTQIHRTNTQTQRNFWVESFWLELQLVDTLSDILYVLSAILSGWEMFWVIADKTHSNRIQYWVNVAQLTHIFFCVYGFSAQRLAFITSRSKYLHCKKS